MSRTREKLDIYSPMKGRVMYVLKNESSYGRRLYIEYDNCILMFAHLDQILVREGQEVNSGDRIGVMGSTGYSESTHLHVSAFNKRAKSLTAQWAIDPTYILKLAPYWITNTKVSNGFGSKFCNPKLDKHEGLDVGTQLIEGWETKKIDPLFQDYLLKKNHPEFYEE